MYTIQSNRPISGMHWGVEFTAGVAETDDVALANKLIRKGYAVTCVSEPKETPVPAPEPVPALAEEPTPEPAQEPTPEPAQEPVVAKKTAAKKPATKKKGG